MTEETYFCGTLVSPAGLEPVARMLAGCSWPVEAWRSGHDGTLRLRSRAREVELDMDSGQGPSFVFSGTVEGDAGRALRLLGDFSARLAAGGVVHRVELYPSAGSPEMLGYLHHGWPRGDAGPGG